MHDDATTRERILDPVDRISEILFGLIMALTFTGLIGASLGEQGETRALLRGAIGCNLAWGLVDGVMFVLTSLVARGHGLGVLRSVRSDDIATAHRAIRDSFDPIVVDHFDDDAVESLRRSLHDVDLPNRPRVRTKDLRAALGVALLVFLSTFPLVVPFIVLDTARTALRVSNAIAIAMLFACGFRLGQHAGGRPVLFGAAVATLGVVLVPLTIALGG